VFVIEKDKAQAADRHHWRPGRQAARGSVGAEGDEVLATSNLSQLATGVAVQAQPVSSAGAPGGELAGGVAPGNEQGAGMTSPISALTPGLPFMMSAALLVLGLFSYRELASI